MLIAGPSSTAAKIPTHRANGYELIARAEGEDKRGDSWLNDLSTMRLLRA